MVARRNAEKEKLATRRQILAASDTSEVAAPRKPASIGMLRDPIAKRQKSFCVDAALYDVGNCNSHLSLASAQDIAVAHHPCSEALLSSFYKGTGIHASRGATTQRKRLHSGFSEHGR